MENTEKRVDVRTVSFAETARLPGVANIPTPRSVGVSQSVHLTLQAAILLLLIVGVGTTFAAREMTRASGTLAVNYRRESGLTPSAPDRADAVTPLLDQSERNARQMNLLLGAQATVSLFLGLLIYQCVGREWAQHQRQEAQEAQLQQHNAQLQQQAQTDALTGLRNRRAFQDRLQDEWARATRYGHPLSLLMIDVDHFKHFNDTWGHLVGDETLRETAALLEAQSRASDLVARYGGEEFALLLPHTSEADALLTAERIRAAFERHPWKRAPITVSIGVAALTPEIQSPLDLVQQSDNALYWAKQQGRNRSIAASEVGVGSRE